MRSFIFGLLLSTAAFGQVIDWTVVDEAKVLDVLRVTNAAQSLAAAGADVRIVTIESLHGATMDGAKATRQALFPSWRAPDGGMKNNLIVLMVAVKDRKVGFYYGSLWKRVLDSEWNNIESEEMKPRFRDRDFTGGFIGAMQATTGLIEASRHPIRSAAPAVIVQQKPMDLTIFFRVLGWLLGLCFAVLCFLGISAMMSSRRQRRELVSTAKQRAKIVQQEVVRLLGRLIADLPAYSVTETNKTKVGKVTSLVNGASSQFANLKQSSTADPDQEGLTAGQYESIAQAYQDILADLNRAEALMKNLPDDQQSRPSPRRPSYSNDLAKPQGVQNASSTTVQPSGNTNIFAPVIISETERPDLPAPSRDPDPSPSRSDDGGGSSSWGSSSSDSGGSSDWGSSSSDSGGSSDFGSSDSGGGGGGDF